MHLAFSWELSDDSQFAWPQKERTSVRKPGKGSNLKSSSSLLPEHHFLTDLLSPFGTGYSSFKLERFCGGE